MATLIYFMIIIAPAAVYYTDHGLHGLPAVPHFVPEQGSKTAAQIILGISRSFFSLDPF